MSDPIISVILPTRNRPHLLSRAVASVLGQTEPDLELIVVDDNDPRDRSVTRAVLAPWSSDHRLLIIENANPRNASAARNAGLSVARGRWISYLDDDDTYAPEKLASQRACAESTGAPLVLCGVRYHLGPRRRVRQCAQRRFMGAALFLEAQPTTQVLFHRREGAVFFDEELDAAEDQDFFLRLVREWRLEDVPNVPLPLVEIHPQSTGLRVNAASQALWQAQRRVLLRHALYFGRAAQRLAIARSALIRQRGLQGGWARLWRASIRLYAVGGKGECRLILNTWMLRFPGLRRLAVS